MDDIKIKLLKKNLRGELYDLTFTSKGNVTGNLKSNQEGTTLTLEKAIHELLIIEETTEDDKTAKRELRKNFLIRCYYIDELKSLFEAYTQFLNGGENTTSPFIINVSGGNLIILFAHLIMHINSAKQNKKTPPLNFGTDKLKEQFEKLMSKEKKIPLEIIESAELITANGFSDLDFYIIENLQDSKRKTPAVKKGGVITPPPPPPPSKSGRLQRSAQARAPPKRLFVETSKAAIERNKRAKINKAAEKAAAAEAKAAKLLKAKERAGLEKIKRQEKKDRLEAEKQAKEKKEKQQAEKLDKITKANCKCDAKPSAPSITKDFKEGAAQGFIVYRIKTGVFLEDYLDIVFRENSPSEPNEFEELKEALLDLFIFNNIDNEDYNPFEKNHVTEEDYKKLHKHGLPNTIGTGKIEIYPQLFQKKYLDIPELSDNCKNHLKYLDHQKRILEAEKNLNIHLLLACLKDKNTGTLDHINLILFLHELCKNINNALQDVTIDSFDTFASLDSLHSSDIISKIISRARHVLITHPVTISLREKLERLFMLQPYNIKLVSSKTKIENNPVIDDKMIELIQSNLFTFVADDEIKYTDNELLLIDDDIKANETANVSVVKCDLIVEDYEGGYKKKIGKKLKKSKKKRKVNKKTKNKHNKKNKRTRRKKNNKTEKKVRK